MKRIIFVFAVAITMCLMNGLVFAQDTTLTITSNGNVGIGITTPSGYLDVTAGATSPGAEIFRAISPAATNFDTNDVAIIQAGPAFYTGTALRIQSRRGNSSSYGLFEVRNNLIGTPETKLYVRGDGNVGIGTTSPAEQLEVTGDIRATRVQVSSTLLGWQNGGEIGFPSGDVVIQSNPNRGIIFRHGGLVEFMRILNDGKVGIGTTAPDQLLSVNGNASKVGGGSWATFSDRRVKQDISTFSDGLSVVKAIRPVTFRYNGKLGYPTDKTYVGVIAQEIQSVAPYTVDTYRTKLNPEDTEETDILRFDGSALTYILINAVKELDTKIEEIQKLREENQKLSAQLTELESLVKTLIVENKNVGSKSMAELR